MDWFLYDMGLRHERVNEILLKTISYPVIALVGVRIRGSEMLVFQKILRTY